MKIKQTPFTLEVEISPEEIDGLINGEFGPDYWLPTLMRLFDKLAK